MGKALPDTTIILNHISGVGRSIPRRRKDILAGWTPDIA
jgi:hypothetical protein